MQFSIYLRQLLRPVLRNRIARIFLLIGTIGPGVVLLFKSKQWGSSPVFQQLSNLPIPLWMWGLILLIASVLILIVNLRDIGYVIAGIFYVVATISGISAAIAGKANSALIFTLPVLMWAYFEASLTSSQERDLNLSLAAAENQEKGD